MFQFPDLEKTLFGQQHDVDFCENSTYTSDNIVAVMPKTIDSSFG